MSYLSIFINDQLAFEHDLSKSLDANQLAFLNKMDGDMDRGFRISGEMISEPDAKQKATFVAMNLLRALQQEDDAKIAVACAYIGHRLPHVIEVRASDQGDRIHIEFVEEH